MITGPLLDNGAYRKLPSLVQCWTAGRSEINDRHQKWVSEWVVLPSLQLFQGKSLCEARWGKESTSPPHTRHWLELCSDCVGNGCVELELQDYSIYSNKQRREKRRRACVVAHHSTLVYWPDWDMVTTATELELMNCWVILAMVEIFSVSDSELLCLTKGSFWAELLCHTLTEWFSRILETPAQWQRCQPFIYLFACVCVCKRVSLCVCVCMSAVLVWDSSVFMLGSNCWRRHFRASHNMLHSVMFVFFCWRGSGHWRTGKQFFMPPMLLFSSVSSSGTVHVGWTDSMEVFFRRCPL